MRPLRGRVYELDPAEGAEARAALVLSEDDWNAAMNDSVIVPLYDGPPTMENPLRPTVGDLVADCTRVGGVGHELLLADRGFAQPDEIQAVVAGVRLYLDVETLLAPPRLRQPPAAGRPDWWPRRGEVYYGHRFAAQREIYGVITDDEWNVRNDYATCAYITSGFKEWRDRWQIPLSTGGYAITGDIEPFLYVELDNRNRDPEVQALTREDLRDFANGLVLTLGL